VEALKNAAKAPEGTVIFLWNLHRLLGGLEIVQVIQNLVPTLKEKGNCIVVLAPSAEKLPEEFAVEGEPMAEPVPEPGEA
jgi:hypothetical protein